MKHNVLAQKKQLGRKKLTQHPTSMKYLTAVISACLMPLPFTVVAQPTMPGISEVNTVTELITPGRGPWSNLTTLDTGSDEYNKDAYPSFGTDEHKIVGVWVNGGSFTDTNMMPRACSPTLFQVGGSVQYTGNGGQTFENDTNSLGGSISLGQLYTSFWEPYNQNQSLTFAVIGSSNADSILSATHLNSFKGLEEHPFRTTPDSISIFVDGANSKKLTKMEIENSAEIVTSKDSQETSPFIVQNSGLFEVGKELYLMMRHEKDRFIIQNNLRPGTGIIVKGNVEKEGSSNTDHGTDFNFCNSAEPLKDISSRSDYARIENSNIDVQNGGFVLWGGKDVEIYQIKKGEEANDQVEIQDKIAPENTFLQIINDDQSKATFHAKSINVHSVTENNTTTLLLGHGANVDTDCVSLLTDGENRTAILMLGDTKSRDANYSPKIKTVDIGKLIGIPELDNEGKPKHDEFDNEILKGYELEKGTRKIIFNNGFRGEGATEASFRISGYGGIVHVQTGRTILSYKNDFHGKTKIDPNATLILPNVQGAGYSDIEDNGELIYRKIRDKQSVSNRIWGTGDVVFENSDMKLPFDAEWKGVTDVKTTDIDAPASLEIGKVNKPIRMAGSVNVSERSTFLGFGSITGSLKNSGSFLVGDTSHTSPFNFEIGGDVHNQSTGTIQLSNGKISAISSHTGGEYSGNKLTVHGNYAGYGGKIIFNTALNGDNDSPTDKLIVLGDTDGSSRVKVNNLRGHGEQTTNGIELIRVEGNSSGTFVKDGRIFAGAYEYNLERGTGANDKNWYLISRFRPETGAYIGNSAVVQTLFSSRLHDRIGDLWYADPYAVNNQLTGVWMKQRGNYNTWRESSGQTRNRTQMYATQIGADVASWTSNGENRFLVGWVAGYGHGRTKSRSIHSGYHAIGTVDGLNVGLTGTWYQDGLHHQGMYVDTWLTYGWFDNKVKGQGIETEKYHSRGFTGSLETGYTWKLGEHITEKGCDIGWFLQPQAQMIWSGVKTDTFHEHNGTTVKSRGRNNIQTRLGARLLMDTNLRSYANGIGGTQFFIEGNWVHNTKSHGVEMNGTVFNQEGARHLGEVKFGINGKPTDNLHVWTNVTVRAGTHHYRDLTGMVGLKYSF